MNNDRQKYKKTYAEEPEMGEFWRVFLVTVSLLCMQFLLLYLVILLAVLALGFTDVAKHITPDWLHNLMAIKLPNLL